MRLTSANGGRVHADDLDVLQLVAAAGGVRDGNRHLGPSRDDDLVGGRDVVAAVAEATDCHVGARSVRLGCQVQEVGVT